MPPTSRPPDLRHRRHEMSTARAHGHHGIVSVRSFTAFERNDIDDDDDDKASIPDILERCYSLGTSVAETVASPTTFRKIWAETENLVSLNNQPSHSKRLESPWDSPGPRDALSAETRSLSTPPRSFLTPSTQSKANSSSSSFALVNSDALPGLRNKSSVENDGPESLVEGNTFNLTSQYSNAAPRYSLETRSKELFSTDHLRIIFDNPLLFQKFTDFLYAFRPRSAPVLAYYLDAIKALKAISYGNSITQELVVIKGLEFSEEPVPITTHKPLLKKADKAFQTLAREDLPAYITHSWVQVVKGTIKRKITDTLHVDLKGLSEGLADSFCLTDPSRRDNPIVFASEGFYKTTQYGIEYAFGRNCRFLQGPNTNKSSIKRIREHLDAGKEHCETILNFRRDGSPFISLLMAAPLFDSRGVIRHHIGAQVDVSGLAKECIGLESLKRLIARKRETADLENGKEPGTDKSSKDELYELAEMFSLEELSTIQQASTHQEQTESAEINLDFSGPRQHNVNPIASTTSSRGKPLPCIYEHYLLVRPHPHLRILFASPLMRVPGILQSSFMLRIGGSKDVHEPIIQKFADGHVFTEKIRWVTKTDNYGKGRWIHCTPLLGADRAVGIWMVVLVDDEVEARLRRGRVAPPVDFQIGRQRPFDGDMVSSSSREGINQEPDKRQPRSVRISVEDNAPESSNPIPCMSCAGG